MGAHLKPAAVAAAAHLKGYEPLVGPQHAVHLVEAVGRGGAWLGLGLGLGLGLRVKG